MRDRPQKCRWRTTGGCRAVREGGTARLMALRTLLGGCRPQRSSAGGARRGPRSGRCESQDQVALALTPHTVVVPSEGPSGGPFRECCWAWSWWAAPGGCRECPLHMWPLTTVGCDCTSSCSGAAHLPGLACWVGWAAVLQEPGQARQAMAPCLRRAGGDGPGGGRLDGGQVPLGGVLRVVGGDIQHVHANVFGHTVHLCRG